MKKPFFLILLFSLLSLPPATATNATWALGNNFTFDVMEVAEDYVIFGTGRLNATPTSTDSVLVTLHNYSSAVMVFDVNESTFLIVENGTFNVVSGQTYTLYDNTSNAINSTQAINSTISFTMAAGQGYCIQAGDDNGDNNSPPSGGGGGGPSPKPKVTAFTEPQTVIENETMASVIKELELESMVFCRMERQMAAVFAVTGGKTGEYPLPETDVFSTLTEPVMDIGGDIYEKSASEVLKAWSSSDTVVIARGDLEVDSITAIAYAKANDVPILLTRPQELPSETLVALETLNAKSFVIIGGEMAVGSVVADELAGLGSVTRIAGKNRQETAVEVAEALGDIETIIIADGERPSIDAAIIAAGYNAPILYVSGDIVPQGTRDFIKVHKKTKRGKDVKLVFADVSGYIINHRLDEDF